MLLVQHADSFVVCLSGLPRHFYFFGSIGLQFDHLRARCGLFYYIDRVGESVLIIVRTRNGACIPWVPRSEKDAYTSSRTGVPVPQT